VKSLFRYPGGKHRLSGAITQRLTALCTEDTTEYFEPCFGAGNVGITFLSQNPKIKSAWINDRDPGVACLWNAVIHSPGELIEKIKRFTPSVSAFDGFKSQLLGIPEEFDPYNVEVGFMKLAVHLMSYGALGTRAGGPLGGKKQESKDAVDSRWSAEYRCRRVEELHRLLTSIDLIGGGCTCLDFFHPLMEASRASIVYLDPPYFDKGNDLYQFPFSQTDHERLANILRVAHFPWVLSYDDHPEVNEMYRGTLIQPIPAKYTVGSVRQKTELIITPNKGR
jgi:DNA adenine methylase